MTRARRNYWMQTAFNLSLYVILFLGTIVLFFAGPRLEVLLYPVIGSFEITRQWVQEGHYYVEGVMMKNRGECEPLALVMTVFGDADDPNSKTIVIDTSLEPHKDVAPLRHRPSGAQHWGPWILKPPMPPLGPLLRVVVSHRCHFLWTTQQIIYEGPTSNLLPDEAMSGEPT